jgi:hypothetical protein
MDAAPQRCCGVYESGGQAAAVQTDCVVVDG